MQRDRTLTEQRLLDAVGQIIAEEGINQIGINHVARRAGVHKVLIYRYFGGLEGLLQHYLNRDRPVVIAPSIDVQQLQNASVEEVYEAGCAYIINEFRQLRADPTAREVLRENLLNVGAGHSPISNAQESQLVEMIEGLSTLVQTQYGRAFMAIVVNGLSMLVFQGQQKRMMLGVDPATDEGWAQIEEALRRTFRGVALFTKERLAAEAIEKGKL
jgi:AcrR family transcriptional regulator